jgi:ribonuclease BN (tRNA processing enzyme)
MKLGDKNAIFDTGPGTLKNLLEVDIDCLNLDFIFYTHLHLDHISEFATILFAAKIPPAIRSKSLVVYGPEGIEDYYRKINELYKDTIYTDAYKIILKEIKNKSIDIDGFEISARTVEHHDGGMGYRIITPEGRIVVYSGDTDYCKEIVELSKNADLLILECSFPDDMKMKGHLGPITAGRIAREAKAKKLILVHMYPICGQYNLLDACKKEFKGKLIVGEDFMHFDVT